MLQRILIIDDEQEFGLTLAERLLLRGYDAKAIADVEHAMIELSQSIPSVVLLDLKMPGGFGTSTVKAIKDISPSTRILIITGHGGQTDLQEALQSGADGFLIKPVDIDELLQKINELQTK